MSADQKSYLAPPPRIFVLSLFSLLILSLSAAPVSAATIRVDSTCTLAQAINEANGATTGVGSCEAGSDGTGATGHDTITFTDNITLGAALPDIASSITFEGANKTISGNNLYHIFHITSGPVVINNLTLKNGKARADSDSTHYGGAIFAARNSGSLTISKSRFIDNLAPNLAQGDCTDSSGGALYSLGSDVTISDSEFRGNRAFSASAVWVNGTLTVQRSSFTNHRFPATTSDQCRSHENSVFRLQNTATFTNVTISNNSAVGIISLNAGGTLSITHSTIANNKNTDKREGNGGLVVGGTLTLRLHNNIIAGNTPVDCRQLTGGIHNVTVAANVNNLIKDGTCSPTYTGDPKLASFRGAPGYHPLWQGSPAIDAAASAHCPSKDIRGVTRPVPAGGACDIGAYEGFIVPPPPPVEADDDADPSPTPVPTQGPVCGFCADLLARGYRLRARYGLESGVQFRRVDRDGIGVQSALDAGFMDAVDVYGYAEQGVEVCFPAAGSLILLDATTSPRAPASVPGYTREGRTCAAIDRPGTLVLVDNPPAGLPILTTSVTFAAPAPVAEAVGSGYQQLYSCMVTTKGLIRFRDAPAGAPLLYTDPWGRQEHGWLPGYVTLTALERTPDWFKVDYYGTRGWVSAHHVTTHGVCG